MSTRKILAFLSVTLLFAGSAVAQSKLAKEADDAFREGYYYNATELYKKAFVTESKMAVKSELIFKVGECYRMLGDAQQAEVWYEKANKAQYPDPITYYYIGEALKEQGKYSEAIVSYNKFKEKKPGDMKADAGIAACTQAQKWKDDPSRYSVDPEVLLNTQQWDWATGYADKKNEDLVFSSSRPAATGTETEQHIGESFNDLFFSSRDKLGKWSEPVKLPIQVNTPAHEAAPVFNAKRTVMYFTRCEMDKKKQFGCDIWMSKKVGSNYSEPEKLVLAPERAKEDSVSITVGHPALSADDLTLVFASNMAGNHRNKDLYQVKLDKDGKPTGKVTSLGSAINTPKDEVFPFLRQDGTLYFSTDGRPGMGGMDIFRAAKTGESWSEPENMKFPINSSMDDVAICFEGTEERGFFTSNRPGGKGQMDIWRFYMPNLEFALQGTVYNKSTNSPMPGVTITVAGTDGSNYTALTDENGGFKFAENGKDRFIKENTTYSIQASMDKFLVVKDQITTVGLNESTTFVKEYFLQPTDVIIHLPEVQYAIDSYEILDAGKDSLEFLYNVLVDNPTITIELQAHTDSRKTRKYKGGNQELSQLRAQSCVNYLVTRGIDPVRMTPKGYGPSVPRITDAEIAKMATKEEKEAAHQKNRRTEMRVLTYDYVPKESQVPQTPVPQN
ncbi:MAG: OmpA family protein [Flavobacteriales bacterium]|nr:OmpA family protein [Flavobacteriales bacterium]